MRKLFTLLFTGCSLALLAQPGTLDPTFDGDGIVQTDLVPEGDTGYDVLPTNDGLLYVCGYLNDGSQDKGYLLRLLENGAPDPAFGTVVVPSGNEGRAFRLAFAPDSSVYLCGYADTLGYQTFTLWRVLPTGTMDMSFGSGGRSSVQIGFSDARARHLAVQPDGKVVLVGYESSGFGRDGVLVRFLPNGTLDASFSGDGIMLLAEFDDLDQLDAVALMDDGSIIAGGYAEVNNDDRALIIKVSPIGTLAFGFGTGGVLTPVLGSNESRVYGLAVSEGEILAAGALITSSTSADLFITRRTANGGPVTTFGTFGVAEIDVQDDDWMDDMKLLPDGRIVFTGYTGSTAPGGDIDFLLGCYAANGQPDLGFGTDGIVVTETSPNYEGGFGVNVQPDGKLVVAGFGGVIGNSSLVVLRYANDLTTGICHGAGGGSLLIHPLPTSDHVNIQLPGDGSARMDLLDATGRVVGQWQHVGGSSATLDVRHVPVGTYHLRAVQGVAITTATVMIAR